MKKYSLGVYEKSMPNSFSIEEKLLTAVKFGFDFLEISIDETDEKLSRLKWSNKERFDVLKSFDRTGMRIITMCLSGHRKYPLGSLCGETSKRALEIMKDAIDFSCDLGIRIIQIAGYDEYYNASNEITRKNFEENLLRSVEYTSSKGVILAFETMETPFMDTVEKSMYYVNKINSPYLKIYPDLGNLTNASKIYKKAVECDVSTGQGQIVAMHLKETVPGEYREIPFGTGHVDFHRGIEQAKNLGVNLFVGEFWAVESIDWKRQMEESFSFLAEKLNRVFGLVV